MLLDIVLKLPLPANMRLHSHSFSVYGEVAALSFSVAMYVENGEARSVKVKVAADACFETWDVDGREAILKVSRGGR